MGVEAAVPRSRHVTGAIALICARRIRRGVHALGATAAVDVAAAVLAVKGAERAVATARGRRRAARAARRARRDVAHEARTAVPGCRAGAAALDTHDAAVHGSVREATARPACVRDAWDEVATLSGRRAGIPGLPATVGVCSVEDSRSSIAAAGSGAKAAWQTQPIEGAALHLRADGTLAVALRVRAGVAAR
jgi:hypothetical protein